MKPIRLTAHAESYCEDRGFSVREVETAIREGNWQPAERNRLQCRKEFLYKSEWLGKYYETKMVKPIFVDEADEIVVITVYTFYY